MSALLLLLLAGLEGHAFTLRTNPYQVPSAAAQSRSCAPGDEVAVKASMPSNKKKPKKIGKFLLETLVELEFTPKLVKCRLEPEEFHPNFSALYLTNNASVEIARWKDQNVIISSYNSRVKGLNSRSGSADSCADYDRKAVDSISLMWSGGGCAKLQQVDNGYELQIVSTSKQKKDGTTLGVYSLPNNVDYIAMTSGMWVHDLGGMISILSRTQDGNAICVTVIRITANTNN